MDRVKAAIFSSLGERVPGARVLDLFAGSGALGIEALSRGAASATFVEKDRTAIAAIERNLARTGLTGQVRQQDVFDFLRRGKIDRSYDLIFADPPYDEAAPGQTYTDLLLDNNHLLSYLTNKGVFVLEKRPGERWPATKFWLVLRRKSYGATETTFLQKKTGE
jgi:16S rRNA (guanine966-N2)-methyltransferase